MSFNFGLWMSNRTELTDEQWETFYQFLLLHGRNYNGSNKSCRRFLHAVFWLLRSDAQWRLLLE